MTIAEQIALAAVFYFGQVFVFFRLINKKMLEWFLLILCKEHTLTRSTNLVSTKPCDIMFLIKKRRSADAQYLLSNLVLEVQKQLFADFLQNRCS